MSNTLHCNSKRKQKNLASVVASTKGKKSISNAKSHFNFWGIRLGGWPSHMMNSYFRGSASSRAEELFLRGVVVFFWVALARLLCFYVSCHIYQKRLPILFSVMYQKLVWKKNNLQLILPPKMIAWSENSKKTCSSFKMMGAWPQEYKALTVLTIAE